MFRANRRSLSSFPSDSALGAGGPGSISGFGQLINQLQSLATSDPTQFKRQTADIASQLSKVAGQTSGLEAQLFQNLATQFQQASQTGEVPKLATGRYHQESGTITSTTAAGSGRGNATSAASTSGVEIAQNANGTYGPDNAVDLYTAEVQAASTGLGFGQTFTLPDGTVGEVV